MTRRADNLAEYWSIRNDLLARQRLAAAFPSLRHNWIELWEGMLADIRQVPPGWEDWQD